MLKAFGERAGDLYRRTMGSAKGGVDRFRARGADYERSFRGGYNRTGADGTRAEAAGRFARRAEDRLGAAKDWTYENPIKASVIATGGVGAAALPFMVGGEGPDEELMAEYERLVSSGRFQGSFEDFVEMVMGG